ncbi:MAG: trypsin-like serine protease [Halopenitus sp.]
MPSKKEFDRRAILKGSVIASGVASFAGIPNLVRGKSTTEIVTHKSGDKPAKTKLVPKIWKDHLDTTRRARQKMVDQYRGKKHIRGFGIISVEDYYGGKRGFGVAVKTSLKVGYLPSEVLGIPIVEKEYIEPKYMHCYNTGDYDNLPGGVILDGVGSSGSQYYIDPDGDGAYDQHMLTAAHLAGDQCNDLTGTTITQTDDDWGTVKTQSASLDAITCKPNSGFDVSNKIKEESGTKTVAGFVTKNGLADMQATGELMYKMGMETGEEVGYIDEMEVSSGPDCSDFNGEGVKAKIDVAQGDSGGPMYDVDGSDAYIIGISSTATDKKANDTDCEGDTVYSRTMGPTAYEINNVFGGQFIAPI